MYATIKSETFVGRGMTFEEAAEYHQRSREKLVKCFSKLADFACEYLEERDVKVFVWIDEDYGYAIPLTATEWHHFHRVAPPEYIQLLELDEDDLEDEVPFLQPDGFWKEIWYTKWLETYGNLD